MVGGWWRLVAVGGWGQPAVGGWWSLGVSTLTYALCRHAHRSACSSTKISCVFFWQSCRRFQPGVSLRSNFVLLRTALGDHKHAQQNKSPVNEGAAKCMAGGLRTAVVLHITIASHGKQMTKLEIYDICSLQCDLQQIYSFLHPFPGCHGRSFVCGPWCKSTKNLPVCQ